MVVHSAGPLTASRRGRRSPRRPDRADTFDVRNHGPVPDLSPERWRPRAGAAERPLDLSLCGLRDEFACHQVVRVLQCAGNRRAGLMKVRDTPGEEP